MADRIGSRDARRNFADLLGRVRYGGEVIIVERAGTPMAAMVPLELLDQLLSEREARFEVLDRVRERGASYTADEIARDVAAAVAEVRKTGRESDDRAADRR